MFFKLGYPHRLVDATVTSFQNSVFLKKDHTQKNNAMSEGNIVNQRISALTFQRSEICGLRQLKDLGNNIGNPIQTVFTSPKIGEQLKIQERKPPVVSRQCMNLNVICAIQIIYKITELLRARSLVYNCA